MAISISAPMENKFLKALILKNKQRAFAPLLFVCLLSCGIRSGSAQLPNQKRITALQFMETVEGSRVTIVSDSALTDYEAFRRGDRFYVKIPLADFKSGPPRCCASGFENVQVQRVGDSVIVTFKLQPGAAARVDQRSNRLDVIFSSPNKALRANSASNSGATGARDLGTSQPRGIDAAGPMPPGSISGLRQRPLTEGERVASQSRSLQSPGTQPTSRTNSNTGPNNQSLSGNNQPSTGQNQSTTGSAASGLPSPGPAPSSIPPPSTSSSYPSSTTATPAESAGANPAIGSTSSSGLAGGWRTRSKAALQWVRANRLATLLGVLILLSLVLYLVAALRRRKKSIAAKRGSASRVQPKVQPQSLEAEFDELLGRGPATSPASSNAPKEFVKNPATAPAVVVVNPQNRSRVLAQPSIVSPSTGPERASDEDEREVFEL